MNDMEFILQYDWRKNLIQQIGTENWLRVYQKPENDGERLNIFPALIHKALFEKVLRRPEWDMRPGYQQPSVISYYDDGDELVAIYSRFGTDEGIEPVILERSFHGLRAGDFEICEEFRLFHNLFLDKGGSVYSKYLDNGDEEEIVRIGKHSVDIQLKALKQYAGAKDAFICIYFDIIRFSAVELENIDQAEWRIEFRADNYAYHFHVNKTTKWGSKRDFKTSSLLYGKKLIPGTTREASGIWDSEVDEQNEDFVDFIIEVDEQGDPITFTCDPDKLANYFGKNPDAPHYLTPVFFRRDVLQKYYDDPQKYSVSDNTISCAYLWNLRIDNNHAKYVIAFLGDLGTYLPEGERAYWKSYNVVPDGTISDVTYRRAFLAEFAESEVADLHFKSLFRKFQEKWKERYGWYFFKPLAEEDQHYFAILRIPLKDNQREFDEIVLALTKVIVDSLNEAELQKLAGPFPENTKGIGKLEAYLSKEAVPDYQTHIRFLRDLQTLRSSGTAHRKSDNYRQIAQIFGIGEKDFITIFEDILHQATEFLQALSNHFFIESDT